uniref:Acyltransferase 3 domain-containing protein n=1 Tax=Acrobeloides nanus TaxID=290746 RepID=A0A914E9S2_9BILA
MNPLGDIASSETDRDNLARFELVFAEKVFKAFLATSLLRKLIATILLELNGYLMRKISSTKMYDLPQCVEEYPYGERFQKYSELEPTSIIISSWLLFIFVATLLEKKTSIGSLSMKTSWQELTQKRTSKLNCVDYIRVAAILWVMVNHIGSEGRIDILERLPSAATFKENIHSHPFFGPVFGNSALGVEIFLVLSGLLAARSWSRFQMSSKRLDRTYVCFLVKRIFRLFPSVAVFVWLAQGSYSKQYLPR